MKLNSKSPVAVACFLPGRAKDLSAPLCVCVCVCVYIYKIFIIYIYIYIMRQLSEYIPLNS